MKNLLARATLAYAKITGTAAIVLTLAVGCARPLSSVDGELGAVVADVRSMGDSQVIQFGVDRLHRHVQPDGPVGVVVEDPDVMQARVGFAVYAYTERAGAGYLIHVGSDLHGGFLLAVLEHEWAHALDFDDGNDHGVQWGIELSRAYRAVTYDVDTPDAVAVPIQNSPQSGVSQKDPPSAGDGMGINQSAGHRGNLWVPRKR